jgi:myo-inositol-1(or 4)-monophosphatase
LAIAAGEAGALVVRSRFGTALDRVDKGAGDFATAADLEAEAAIFALLEAERPADRRLGEESGLAGGVSDRVWLVDPLCGTLNFAAGTTLVAVNVALQLRGETAAAASADPFTGEVFWTDGMSAFVRRDGMDSPLAPTAESRLVDINLDPLVTDEIARLLTSGLFQQRFRPRVTSTTLAVAWVAAGRRAAFVTAGPVPTDSVHYAPGIALARAAGCVVTDITGQPLRAGSSGLVISSDQVTQDVLIGILGDSGSARL